MPTLSGTATIQLTGPTDPVLTAARTRIDAIGVKVDAIAVAVEANKAKLDAILAKIGTGAIPPVEPPVVPPSGDWPIANPVAGGTYALTAGTKQAVQHFDVPVIVKGAGMRKTILDGRGGIGAGFRLAFGKGVIHTGVDFRGEGLSFIGGGRGDGNSDGEASVYFEGTSNATLVRCSFDGGENGVYVPAIYDAPDVGELTLEKCVWGRNSANGLNDGRSHDMYVGAKKVHVLGCVFVGNARGNTIKVRGPHLRVEDSYVGRTYGRWIDAPGPTVITSARNTYVTNDIGHFGSNNVFGFNDESDDRTLPGSAGSFTSVDDTFYFARDGEEVIWVNHVGGTMEFIRPKVFWVGSAGQAPPVIRVVGVGMGPIHPGGLIGANPFVLTAANRVDAPPPPPADPAA